MFEIATSARKVVRRRCSVSWRFIGAVLLVLQAACAGTPGSPAPAPPEPAPPPFPFEVVWTAGPNVTLEEVSGVTHSLERAFTRLEVIGQDSSGLHVVCAVCPGAPEGVVALSDILHRSFPPEVAAWGSLAEFALAIRNAVETRALGALLPVMAEEFSYSFVGIQSPEAAFAVWRSEEFASLDQVPALLDRGIDTHDGRIWSAPPEFTGESPYRGSRIGFRRRPEGRWEWVFLIQGLVP